ncbi:MAG: DUF2093 domain-containing protein [Alphaproteobacteria bacterium]|nr:DUF2093 domain-containing protein [Alphaproteobacteria bacterium]
MNRLEKIFAASGEANLRYLDGEFQVIEAGDHVRCAVTGEKIELANLKYWSVELQEAYASAEVSYQRYQDVFQD